MSKEYLSDLNKEQFEAATFMDGYMRIIAGAGSGKTKTLVSRTANLIDNGVDPSNIVLLTFTNKAAKEMRDRVIDMIGEDAKNITACTFHSFALNFIKGHLNKIGYDKFVEIHILAGSNYDTAIGWSLDVDLEPYAEELKKYGKTPKDVGVSRPDFIKSIEQIYEKDINDARFNLKMTLADWCEEHPTSIIADYKDWVFGTIKRYKEANLAGGRLDYSEMMYYLDQMLDDDSVVDEVSSCIKYVMCDEYQDTNVIQDSILNKMTKKTKNLVVVGDDNQSIYRFRGAKVTNIIDFAANHVPCKDVVLYENYRSVNQILDLSNTVMDHALEGIPKHLHGQRDGQMPLLLRPYNSTVSTGDVVKTIEKLIKNGYKCSEIAVLARSAKPPSALNSISAELSRKSIPHKVFGGSKFIEKKEIVYMLSLLSVTVTYKSPLAWYAVLRGVPGIGEKIANRIITDIEERGYDALLLGKNVGYSEYLGKLYRLIMEAKERSSVTINLEKFYNEWYYPLAEDKRAKLKSKIKQREFDDKFKNEAESIGILIEMAVTYRSARSFLEDIYMDADFDEKDPNFVTLSTIHSAKGLEFGTVFLMDACEGIFPRSKMGTDDDNEELRCLYVALTRAKDKLFVYAPAVSVQFTSEGRKETHVDLSHHLDYSDVLSKFIKRPSILGN